MEKEIDAPLLDILRSESLASAAYQELEKMILNGEIAPGERIDEKAIATRMSVSRGPIREALRALAQDNLVKMAPHRGVFVQIPSLSEALDAYEVRAALFGIAGLRLAESISTEQLGQLDASLDQMDEARCTKKNKHYYELNLEFHATLLQFAGNTELQRLYMGQVKKLHLYRQRALIATDALEASSKEHRQIVEALRTRDPYQTRTTMEGHIISGKNRFLKETDKSRKDSRQTGSS